mmetsp:Transcript_17612/g.40603  ORF Transcript_17612/g.40603 Transcript_17612/m.40603 type:complete len:83 (-) Transcript_17612:469-717(-)
MSLLTFLWSLSFFVNLFRFLLLLSERTNVSFQWLVALGYKRLQTNFHSARDEWKQKRKRNRPPSESIPNHPFVAFPLTSRHQ